MILSPTRSSAPFDLFGRAHLTSLALIGLAALLLFLFRRRLRTPAANRGIRFGMAGLGLLSELSLHGWLVLTGGWTLAYSLPLHLCSLTILLSILMLWRPHRGLFEFVYLAGLAGALQALLTPNLGGYPFPHFVYIQFFVTHGLIVLASLFMIFVQGFRPRPRAVWTTLLVLNVYLGFAMLVNVWTGGNYLYAARKPTGVSLLDFLGPWPWYILWLEGIALLLFLLASLPFYRRPARRKRPSP